MIYDVKHIIVISTTDYESKGGPKQFVLSLDKDVFNPPSFDDFSDKGRKVQDYVNLHFSWLDTLIKVNKVIQNGNNLSIYWSCTLPKDTTLKNSYWIPLDKINTDIASNIN